VILEDYFMSSKEIDRAHFLEKVKEGEINLIQASEHLRVSYPQIKRLWSKYKKEGKKGLVSKKRGKKSNRAIPEDKRKKIATIIVKEYQHCKPLFIKEKLMERQGINFSSEFIRKLMIDYHLWIPKNKKQGIHQRRLRRACEGELVQIDASSHAWFEDRGPKCHLHLLVDDATSKIMGGFFAPEETTEAYYQACLSYFQKMGRPLSLYSDKRGTFVVNKGAERKDTQFARAMKELDIQMIIAHSPQAKGRIERAFGTLQNRLVWEMRLHRISSIEQANVFLPDFIETYNNKYSQLASNPSNAHRPLDQKKPLKYILCTKEERVITKNLELSYNNQIFQLHPDEIKLGLKGSKITVITTLQNEILLEHRGVFIKYTIYGQNIETSSNVHLENLIKNCKTRCKYIPPKDHPYKRLTKRRNLASI
jgi:transposase InsO family protein